MRKPPSNSMIFQKHLSVEGPYYVILDPRGHELATSRKFRNDAWFAIGCELLRDIPESEQCDDDESIEHEGKRPRGFAGIFICQTDDGDYQFMYITNSGRTLLTSPKYQTHMQALNAVEVFRKTVFDIVRRNERPTYMPLRGDALRTGRSTVRM